MALIDDLTSKVHSLCTESWDHIPNAYVIPEPNDLTFGNSGERMNVTVMYADIHRSTPMVDELADTLAAEYYKAFLHCCAKIIKDRGGEIQAYDGDRVMAVFTGEDQATNAVSAALRIHHAVRTVINPEFSRAKGEAHRTLQHTVGIDRGSVLVAKTGVRVDSDLVWVGGCANYAAKLNSFEGLDIEFPTRITDQVMQVLPESLRLAGTSNVWEGPYNNTKGRSHYRSNYWQEF